MSNSLAKKYNFSSLILFALPNIIMMVFLSMYTIVDGVFVSRFISTTALSAVNMVYPIISVELAIGIMLASGGSAIISRKFGERKEKEARQNFSFLMLISVGVGFLCAILGVVFIDEIVFALGASEAQFELCRTYGLILMAFSPLFFLQTTFQTFFVTAGKPMLGLIVTVAAGLTNIALDYIFIVSMDMGIAGAALGTGIGYCIPAFVGLLYFWLSKKCILRFTKPICDLKMMVIACANGSSEMVTNLANAITTFLFNGAFMRFYGEDGVASITIVLYFQFMFSAMYFGYSMGIAPIISYKYGAKDVVQLKKIFKNSLIFLGIASIASYLLSLVVIEPALGIFTHPDTNVFAITMSGFAIFAISFLLMGFSTFASSMFTAFSDGLVSAIISFARTFAFLVGTILLLPLFFAEIGIWLAVPIAEALGVAVSIWYLIRKRKKYGY